jgi:DNA repair protein SbcD/Mre11
MKFVHLGDCHLGGWRQPELKELNLRSFQYAIGRSIKEKVNFVLIAGDLFDSAYPPIDTLKSTFDEFRKLKEENIPVFIIAGSHDYSVSGKTFLEVLEKAGFCKNVSSFKEKDEKIILEPTIYQNVAIYGLPGKKSGLEVEDVERIKIHDSPGLFRILMLHTTIQDAVGNSKIKAANEKAFPKVDYVALGHLHINYAKGNKVYCGPTFPNNISELEELKYGSFYLFDDGQIKRQEIKLKEVVSLRIEMSSTSNFTENILSMLKQTEVLDKIVILRLFGVLEKGKISDIDFQKIESFLKQKNCYAFLKSTSKLFMPEPELKIELSGSDELESEIIKKFSEKNPSKFNDLISGLLNSLNLEKNEDETSLTFEERLLSELKKTLPI